MTKKNSTKMNGRRGSIVDSDHSKYSIQHGQATTNKTTYDELKEQVNTPEEMRDLVRRLPLDAVLPLLSELLEKFNNDREVTAWLKTVLLIHTGYFMTLPDVVKRLSNLYKTLNEELTVYPKLLSMRGRLDLVQGQIDARQREADESDMEDEEDEEEEGQNAYSESSDDEEEEEEIDEFASDDEDIEMNTTEMFAEEEEDDLNTEDEDASDSDIEEE